VVATTPRAVMAVHADDGDGGAAEESSPPISASASFAEDATFESPADRLQEPVFPQSSVAPSGQQASTDPELEEHELADPKRPVHRLPGIWVQKVRYATFESPADRLQVPVFPQSSVAPSGQQASTGPGVEEHELADPKRPVHRLPGIKVQ